MPVLPFQLYCHIHISDEIKRETGKEKGEGIKCCSSRYAPGPGESDDIVDDGLLLIEKAGAFPIYPSAE
jgi:hypothetical protein